MFCNDCEGKLIVRRSKYFCEDCEKTWAEILLTDKRYFNLEITKNYNSIIAFEYAMIKELLDNDQIYGIMFQIKDLYEVIVRIPVLITAAVCFATEEHTAEEKDFLWSLMCKPLSFGDWRAALSKASSVLKKRDDVDVKIKQLVEKVKKFANSNQRGDIVFWRNETIAHGALKLLCDEELYEDVAERLKLITTFLTENRYYFTEMEMRCSNGFALEGDEIDFSKINGELFLCFEDKKIALAPYYNVSEGGIYFFDRYISKLHKTDIIEYLRSKKISLYIPEFNDIAQWTSEIKTHSLESESYTVQERTLCEKFLEVNEYFEPKFITRWIEKNIENNDKVMLLQMEEGMGKSTFVRAIDGLSLSLVDLCDGDVTTRTFYVNSTYNSRVDDFSVAVVDTLRRTSPTQTVANNIKELDLSCPNPKKAFAELLNHFKKYHYSDKKLLFVFDGIDELNVKPNKNITDFIPTADFLDDGVFVLITCRTELASDNISDFIRNYIATLECNTLKVYENSPKYRDFAYDFFTEKVIGRLKMIAKRNKIKDFEATEEKIRQCFDKIERKSVLSLTFIKEILSFEFETLFKTGITIDLGSLNIDSNVYKRYLASIKNATGNRYYDKFIMVLCLLTIVSRPISLEELAYLSGNEAPSFSFLGFINSMRLFLSAKRTFNGTKFEIAHLEQKNAILSLFENKIEEYLYEAYEKIMQYLYANVNFLGREYSYIALLESIFTLLQAKKDKQKSDELFLSLLSLDYRASWTKQTAQMRSEIAVISRLIDYYDNHKTTPSKETELNVAHFMEVVALNYFICNRFELCDYYFKRALKTYHRYEEILTDEQKFIYTNALTHYATYKLGVGKDPDYGAQLYAYSLKITQDLYDRKAKDKDGKLYFTHSYYISELVCMSNVYRDCKKYDKTLQLLAYACEQLELCEDDDRKIKTRAFSQAGYGWVYELIGEYQKAIDHFTLAIERYKYCIDVKVDFYIPDCVSCYAGKMRSFAALSKEEECFKTCEEAETFIRDMQNINKHVAHNSTFEFLLTKVNAQKKFRLEEKMQNTKDYAVRFFAERLTEEEKNSEVLIELLEKIQNA